jgi:hypothetical protein
MGERLPVAAAHSKAAIPFLAEERTRFAGLVRVLMTE